jgi:hypothetical protein
MPSIAAIANPGSYSQAFLTFWATARTTRAVVGRFLRMLFYFGQGWLKSTITVLFPTDNDDLRRAAWRSHLGHDQGPVQELLTELHGCYSEDIALLAGAEVVWVGRPNERLW